MTQAFNLAQLANNLNTSGQLDATDGLNGLVANSNLASSGTADSTTFLRGDRSWATVTQKVLQVVTAVYSSGQVISASNGVYYDTGLTASITPASASNKILVMVTAMHQSDYRGTTNVGSGLGLKRNSTRIAGAIGNHVGTVNNAENLTPTGNIILLDSPASTSSVTYTVQVTPLGASQTINFNRTYGQTGYDSYITLMEIAA